MNDLTKFNVSYELPKITTDLAELKNAIEELETQYNGWLVREDDLPAAKKNVADLNKVAKAISDKRIELAKIIKAPIDVMESELKALTNRVTALATNIKVQTTQYEEKRRADRQAEILAFPEWVDAYMTFDEKWLNVATTDKTIKEGMAAQKQFFTNNALLISTTCNAKGLANDKYLEMLAQHREVAEIVALIENDANVKARYASEPITTPPETPQLTVDLEPEIYELTLRLTATKGQLVALEDFITKLGIKYETVE